MKKTIIIISCFCVLLGPSVYEVLRTGISKPRATVETESQGGVTNTLEQRAEKGDGEACRMLGDRFSDQNTDEAVKWYRRGAQFHDPFCSLDLALIFDSRPDEAIALHRQFIEEFTAQGWSTVTDLRPLLAMSQRCLGRLLLEKGGIYEMEGFAWTKKAAEGGDDEAALQLGRAYYYGVGTAKDPEQAVHWYRIAGKRNVYAAYVFLGWCYYEGQGVGTGKNYVKSYACYNIATQHGITTVGPLDVTSLRSDIGALLSKQQREANVSRDEL